MACKSDKDCLYCSILLAFMLIYQAGEGSFLRINNELMFTH